MRAGLAALLCGGLFAGHAALAGELDRLSGDYHLFERGKPARETISIRKIDTGWRVQLGSESHEIGSTRTKEVQDLFKGLDPAAIELQCGEASYFFVCHVKPGTRLQAPEFTSTTGYFTSIPDVGLVEMVRAAGR